MDVPNAPCLCPFLHFKYDYISIALLCGEKREIEGEGQERRGVIEEETYP